MQTRNLERENDDDDQDEADGEEREGQAGNDETGPNVKGLIVTPEKKVSQIEAAIVALR